MGRSHPPPGRLGPPGGREVREEVVADEEAEEHEVVDGALQGEGAPGTASAAPRGTSTAGRGLHLRNRLRRRVRPAADPQKRVGVVLKEKK